MRFIKRFTRNIKRSEVGNISKNKFFYRSFQVIISFLILSVFFTPALAQASPWERYSFDTKWPSIPQPWYFNWPSGIAVDSSGNVYVADTDSNCIQKFTSSGTYITKWGSAGSGDGQFMNPDCIAVDSSGNVYVSDGYTSRVQKFSSSGAYITKWGSWGSGDGQFYGIRGIAVNSAGYVYVVDIDNNRVQKFTSSGTFVTKWGSYGSGDGHFDWPEDVAVDSSGNVYVTDMGNSRIQKFTSSGTFITKWGSYGSGDGQFDNPHGICVDASGNVYVADVFNDRIQKFNSSGNFIAKWSCSGEDLAADLFGNIYAVDSFSSGVEKFDSAGTLLARWSSTGTGDGQFNRPLGITVDSTSNVYVADYFNHRIQKFDSSGSFLTKWGSNGSGDGQFDCPNDVAVDTSGNVYVADEWNHRIQKFDSSGNFLIKWGSEGSGNGQFLYPYSVEVDSNDNVYVIDENERIQKFDSYGNFLTKWSRYGLTDIAIDTMDNLYVVNRSNNLIQKFDSSGNFIAQWGSPGTDDGQLNLPYAIAVDANGDVYVADEGARVQKFTSSGAFITRWGSPGTGDNQFGSPSSLAVDPAGNVYVADWFLNCIKKYSKKVLNVNQTNYFPWYDCQGMKTWILAGNPSTTETAFIDIFFSGTKKEMKILDPGTRYYTLYSDQMGGPVKVDSSQPIFTTQRSIFASSFCEVPGISASGLTSIYYFPWYDGQGMRTWVLVGNPNPGPVTVNVKVGSTYLANGYSIAGNGRAYFIQDGLMDGPVQVTSTGGNVYTTQRSIFQTSFCEVPGISASGLSSTYYFPWYDGQGMRTWVLVGNPNAGAVTVNVKVGSTYLASGYSITGGGRAYFISDGLMDGPVQVTSTGGNVYTTQRSIYQTSFCEVPGIPASGLTSTYYFPWYDGQGMRTWVLVGNPNAGAVAVNVKVGSTYLASSYSIAGNGRAYFIQDGLMDGPVQVTSTGGNVYTTQRSIYQTSFWETPGIKVQ